MSLCVLSETKDTKGQIQVVNRLERQKKTKTLFLKRFVFFKRLLHILLDILNTICICIVEVVCLFVYLYNCI